MTELTPEKLAVEQVNLYAGPAVAKAGLDYFQTGKVKVEQVRESSARCRVKDRLFNYTVDISLEKARLYLSCTCLPAEGGRICKHEVAALIALREHLQKDPSYVWRSRLNKVMGQAEYTSRRAPTRQNVLFISMQDTGITWKFLPYLLPARHLPPEIWQAVKRGENPSAAELAQALENLPNQGDQARLVRSTLIPTSCINCDLEAVALANLLAKEFNSYVYYYSTYSAITALPQFLSLLAKTGLLVGFGSDKKPFQKAFQVWENPGSLHLQVQTAEAGVRLCASFQFKDEIIPLKSNTATVLNQDPLWLKVDRQIFRVDQALSPDLLLAVCKDPETFIPTADVEEFREKYLLPLANQIALSGDLITWETKQVEPVRRMYLEELQGELQARLRFGYGEHEVAFDPSLPGMTIQRQPESWGLVRIIRQPEVEAEAYRLVPSSFSGMKRGTQPGLFSLRARVHPVDFLLQRIPRLIEQGFEIYGEEALKTARVNRHQPTLAINISSGLDWFDLQAVVKYGDIEVALPDIRKAIRKKEKYVKLADGTIGAIPEEWVERYRHLFAVGEETAAGIRLSNHHLTLVDQLLAEADHAQIDSEFDRRRARLRDFSGIIPQDLPQKFQGELRPYQKAGYDWLHFLREFGLGGCLADDMGLGKTVQALVFLQSLREACESGSAHLPADLVVLPRSLVVNWQREAARFTPELRVFVYFDQGRPKDPSIFDQYDLVLTTYGILRRDISLLRNYTFHYVLLDESQAIKNPLSQTAKAARLLDARHRLVLTGTPVENNTVELWSQFAFINPGLLGNLEYFQSEFTTPIEKKQDERKAQFLRKLIYPFILRRTKEQVAPELPSRTERILYCDMQPAQRKLYNRTRDYYRALLLGMIAEEGLENVRLKILEGLLRLRQICNHPRLVQPDFRGESGKFELLLETLETLRSEGHKSLVFSQFVQMLKIVRQELDERQIPYVYLDGQTRDRMARVDTFQNDSRRPLPALPFFLISLRAGGLGLNLTAADYVIHIDPWWNPAVEMQASDRTHRIGQDKPVIIYKLIVRDTVEEKILLLQERKKALVNQLISTEASFFKSLTAEDIKALFS